METTIKQAMELCWDEAFARAVEHRDPYDAVERLQRTFCGLASERQQFDELLISWLAEDDANRRLAAGILLAEHGVVRSAVALRALGDRLAVSDDPGAPFERRRVLASPNDWKPRRSTANALRSRDRAALTRGRQQLLWQRPDLVRSAGSAKA